MVIYCTVCNVKPFVNETAFQQHCQHNLKHRRREQELKKKQSSVTKTVAVLKASPSPAPSIIKAASQIVPTPSPSPVPSTSKAAPPASPPGRYYCKLCKLNFSSEGGLKAHYKSGESPWHPKCVRCTEAFENHDGLQAHMAAAHPMTLCVPCQKYVYVGEMSKHLAESPVHLPFACTLCNLRFSTEDLLKKHYRDDNVTPHKSCPRCQEGFEDNVALQAHNESSHPMAFCPPCGRDIYVEDCEKHWAESSNHPTCPACGMSFQIDAHYKQHVFDVHDELGCRRCDIAFQTVEDLQVHFLKSSAHPRCSFCAVGFRNNVTFDKHVCPRPTPEPETQPIQRISTPIISSPSRKFECEPCERIYKNAQALFQHYRDHSAHPTCAICKIGFKDGSDYESHMSTEHNANKATAIEAHSVSVDDTDPITPKMANPAMPRNATQPTDIDTPLSSPKHDERASNVSSPLSTPRSDVGDLQRSLVLSIPHGPIIRSSSEPPPSSAPPSRMQTSGSDGGVEPTVEPWINEEDTVVSQAEEPSTPTAFTHSRTPSVKTESVTPSPLLAPQSAREQEVVSPMPALPPSIVSDSPVRSRSDAVSPEDLTPRDSVRRFPFSWLATGDSPASESTSGRATPLSAHSLLFSTAATKFANQRREEPIKQPQPEVERSISRASHSTRSEHSRGRAKSTRTDTTQTTTSHTRVEREEPPASPKPAVANMNTAPAPRLAWHCRVCSAMPREPTVTLCGHLFCKGCIIMELTKHGQCPVCRAAVLVRLHVGAS